MIVPVGEQTAQKIRPPQKRTVRRRAAAECDVIAPAGAGVPTVYLEFLGRQPHLPRLFVERGGELAQGSPGRCGVDVHFQHARIGRQFELHEAGIGKRWVAFQANRLRQRRRRAFHHAREFEIGLGRGQGREKHVQDPLPRLHTKCRASEPCGGRTFVRDPSVPLSQRRRRRL